jgi:signal transduction histidine kinase
MNEQLESLLRWMLATAPLIAVLSAAGGYLLSRRAVSPMLALAEAIDRLPAADRSARLPVGSKPDEVDHLADRFNRLLNRLRDAERQNQKFVAQAAHQIRTPLTIVLGEAELALADEVDAAEGRAAMRRVRSAAEQMKHRVDELFLLAESESDASVVLTDEIDLEGLAFEVTDLMRGRAATTGHQLELGRIDPVTVLGNEALLREALLELLENACRHSESGSRVVVTSVAADGTSDLLVRSQGGPIPSHFLEHEGSSGMGLRIVGWIARQHGGHLVVTAADGTNTIGIRWPRAASPQGLAT